VAKDTSAVPRQLDPQWWKDVDYETCRPCPVQQAGTALQYNTHYSTHKTCINVKVGKCICTALFLQYRGTSHSKRSGVDTVLPAITQIPALPHKRSPDRASPD